MNESREELVIPRPGRLRRFLCWWTRGTSWIRAGKVLLTLLVLYNLYACVTLRRPPIHGVVVDAETGQPLAGVEICAAARFTVLVPVETADRQRGGGGLGVTDKKGRFSLPSASCVWWHASEGADEPILWGFFIPKWMNEIELHVYDSNYMTQNFGAPPSFLIPYFAPPGATPAFHRWRVPFFGYYYKIVLQKPRDESQWRQKSNNTLMASQYLPGAIAQRWLFNDLTGYLERWPEGEKAATYFSALLGTGLIESCETLKQDWGSKEITREALQIYYERNKKILGIAARVQMEKEPIRKKSEEEEMQAMQDLVPCMDQLLESRKVQAGGER
jgi:hypothetical protein